MTEAYRSVLDISIERQGRAADPPDPPLGGQRLRRRDRPPRDARLLHRRLPQAARGDLHDRPADAVLALLEGYLGYSMADDLLSGMGLAIGYGVALSIPFVGGNLALLIWGAPFPGDPDFLAAHVHRPRAPLPAPDRGAARRPPGPGRFTPPHAVPRQARRPSARHRDAALPRPGAPLARPDARGRRVLVLLGASSRSTRSGSGGPTTPTPATNGAQPDWYLGWLIGALRLMPGFDVVVGDHTLVPNPFWGGVLFPLRCYVPVLLAVARARLTGDRGLHNLLDRPARRPGPDGHRRRRSHRRRARVPGRLGRPGRGPRRPQLRPPDLGLPDAVVVAPFVVGLVTWRVCRELREIEEIDAEQERAVQTAQLE